MVPLVELFLINVDETDPSLLTMTRKRPSKATIAKRNTTITLKNSAKFFSINDLPAPPPTTSFDDGDDSMLTVCFFYFITSGLGFLIRAKLQVERVKTQGDNDTIAFSPSSTSPVVAYRSVRVSHTLANRSTYQYRAGLSVNAFVVLGMACSNN